MGLSRASRRTSRKEIGSSSKDVSERSDAFSPTKFVLLSVFSLKQTICVKRWAKIIAQECKKFTSGLRALSKRLLHFLTR